MLEDDGFGFGQQEKPEHWEEVPYGFTAVAGDDRLEARWDAKLKAYRLTKWWRDPYTQAIRNLPAGIQHVTNPEKYLAREQERFTASGWDFKLL